MRRILFRAKNLKGKWEYGHYVNCNGIHSIVRDWDGLMKTVDPKTLGQYTGFNDSKKHMIFEGDLINAENDLLEIIFDKGSFGYFAEVKSSIFDDKKTDKFFCLSNTYLRNSEVISNVHDKGLSK